jgi:mannose-6-phosphate isomerase-like protein (cupin superfamily)
MKNMYRYSGFHQQVPGPMSNNQWNQPVYPYPVNGNSQLQWGPPQENTYFRNIHLKDYGPNPFVMDIHAATKENNTFRTTLWTGKHFQVTLMSINVGEDIGLERHPELDQFLRIEQGEGMVQMGKTKDRLDFQRKVSDGFAIIVPAGTWHNLTNTGKTPLKLFSIYAPPQHPFGTVHQTKAEAMAAEHHHRYFHY